MLIMPAFHRYLDEGAIIGRLLAAFGEVEFMVGICLGHTLGNRDTGIKALYRIRGETARIKTADALMRGAYEKCGLKAEYTDGMGAARFCVTIRNQFSHCHWADDPTAGLFFTDLGEAAKDPYTLDFVWRHVDKALLKDHEAYFGYAMEALFFLENEFLVRAGKLRVHAFPMPTARKPPSLHNPEDQHIPPWQGQVP